MGVMNLLKANWTGKVGQTVGAKWKDKSTIRSFTPPSNPNTPEQQRVRGVFKTVSAFIALFAPDLKTLSPLNVKGMSVRNAIIELNKDVFAGSAVDLKTLKISRGGLPFPNDLKILFNPDPSTVLNVSWTPVIAPTISAKAKIVIVAWKADGTAASVGSALNSTGSFAFNSSVHLTAQDFYFAYMLDYRGSSKVGSITHQGSITQ